MASATATTAAPAEHRVERAQRVTPLELFFDLVFVFAITQVTGLMSESPNWEGLGRGMLVLAAVWWAWAAYAWLTNAVDPDEGPVRLAMFAAMAAMLIVALAVPTAFEDDGVLFGVAYFTVRALHMAVYLAGLRFDAEQFGALLRMGPWVVAAPALLIVAGFLDGPEQAALWAAALAIDYLGPVIGGPSGFRLSPGHFAERFGLIVIIAIGESIVAIGVGAAGLPLSTGVIVAALLGIAVVAALWWSYFDVVAIVAERKLHEAQGVDRIRLARDSYAYLHLPMIAGIVLFALGVKKTIAHVEDPLEVVPAVGLCGGVALYLLAHIAFRLRNVRSLNRQRLATALVCVAFLPLALEVPALASLAVMAGLLSVLISYEAVRFAEARARVRAARAG